jgi:hypothetical protein
MGSSAVQFKVHSTIFFQNMQGGADHGILHHIIKHYVSQHCFWYGLLVRCQCMWAGGCMLACPLELICQLEGIHARGLQERRRSMSRVRQGLCDQVYMCIPRGFTPNAIPNASRSE